MVQQCTCLRPMILYKLLAELRQKNVHIYPDGLLVSRSSDWILYSVEAEELDKVVGLYGPCEKTCQCKDWRFNSYWRWSATKLGAIVGGQTSCKAPEMAAFEKHLPPDVHIVSCHSLHGPHVDPEGQPLVLIKHRASQESFDLVERILSCFKSKQVVLTALRHDQITADTQAVTHAAFLSMGTAWCANKQFPWEIDRYVGGIENVKANLMLRIYSNSWHVYAGLAILNPAAKTQIKQYAESVTELFKLMLGGHREELERRIKTAGAAVFTPKSQRSAFKRRCSWSVFSGQSAERENTEQSSKSTGYGGLLVETGYRTVWSHDLFYPRRSLPESYRKKSHTTTNLLFSLAFPPLAWRYGISFPQTSTA